MDISQILLRSLFGGFVIFIILFFIEKRKQTNIIGFIYGFLPNTFIFLTLIYYFQNRKKIIKDLTKSTFIGGMFFIIFMYLFYMFFEKYQIDYLVSMFLTLLLSILVIFISNTLFKKYINKNFDLFTYLKQKT
jgi:F0F1-type ATP synthase assembly protein I